MKFFTSFIFAVIAAAPAWAQVNTFSLQMGQPLSVGQLRVIPIQGNQDSGAIDTISLIDAFKHDLVDIADRKADVVTVKNEGKQSLLLLAGELVVGGHQDQAIGEDYVVLPGQTADVPCYCVEPCRYLGSKTFAATGQLLPDWIRLVTAQATTRRLNRYLAQNRIWNEVEKISFDHAFAPGSSVNATLAGPGFKKDVDDLVAKLEAVEDKPETIGMMAVVNGRVFSVDLFPNHKNFEEFRDMLLRLYATESNLVPGDGNAPKIGLDAIQPYLNEIAAVSRKLVDQGVTTRWFQPSTTTSLGVEAKPKEKANLLHGVYFPG